LIKAYNEAVSSPELEGRQIGIRWGIAPLRCCRIRRVWPTGPRRTWRPRNRRSPVK